MMLSSAVPSEVSHEEANSLHEVILHEVMNQEEEAKEGTIAATKGYFPTIKFRETSEAFILDAAVPGVECEDLSVVAESNILTISGELHREKEEQKFCRSVALDHAVRTEAITASLTNGILHLEMPKVEDGHPHQIAIEVGGSIR
jgi:HSP20 family protein